MPWQYAQVALVQQEYSMKLHFFLVHDNHGEYYEWGVEGKEEKILDYLRTISNDVKYMGENEISSKGRTIGHRKYAEDVVCRICKFKYRIGVKHDTNELTR